MAYWKTMVVIGGNRRMNRSEYSDIYHNPREIKANLCRKTQDLVLSPENAVFILSFSLLIYQPSSVLSSQLGAITLTVYTGLLPGSRG